MRADQQRGTHPVTKFRTMAQLIKERPRWAAVGRTLVFTNGCFDLLHPGHVRYLERAADQGDLLLVAVNSDRSVKRLKGPGRPIHAEQERCEILAALASVDFVTAFDEETPLEVIRQILPDILAKGGDWSPDQIVGREVVESNGGRVVSVPFEAGYSTSRIIERIKDPKA